MALIKWDGTEFVFEHGKHKGESLGEVAEDDPRYLLWVHQEVNDLPRAAQDALEDAMAEHDIET